MARSRGFAHRGTARTGPRRQSDWGVGAQSGTDGTGQGITASGALLLTGGSTPTVPGLTLVRTRGRCLFYLTNATADNNGFVGAFGIGVVTVDAFVAGQASVPSPVTDEGSDIWLFHKYFHCMAGGLMSGAGAVDRTSVNSATAVVEFDVDSRAMRKLTVEDAIFASIEVTEIGTATLNVHFQSRILLKLP